MHSHDAGGSTQNENANPPRGRRRQAVRAAGTAALVGGLLAGCQTFAPRHEAQIVQPVLTSPLGPAFIGDPASVEQWLHAPGAELRTRYDVELEPLPEPRPEDLIDRLRASFSLPSSDEAALQRELEEFARHPDYIDRVLDRASRYLYYIAEELEARGMPADLALLPIVESAFDPFAYSHGRAAGLWQIIPGTARQLGVKQNWWFDGRRDVVESTRGALDYLERLHEQFDGDWLLAVAGYNSGEGNVARALKRAEAAGRGRDFWSIRSYLPRETRTYVPRLLAIRDLVAAPEKFELTLPEITNEPHFAIVETGGQIDMSLAADLAGIETDQLYQLNAGVNRWATDPEGPHRMLVPVAQAERFQTAIADLGERERVQWTRHRIAAGETLSHLAAKYNTTPGVLREINSLRGNIIRAGDYLMIPHALESFDSYSLSADSRLERRQNQPRSGERVVHLVRRGDSLWSISQRYGVGVRTLAGWNGMAPGDTLSVGRELVVWVGDGATAVTASAANVGLGDLVQDRMRRVNYIVRRGDSLASIAQRFRVTVAKLLQWNDGLSTNRYLQPGERLVMFVNVTEQST